METKKLFFVLFCLFFFLFSLSLFAQERGKRKGVRWDGSGGWGLNSNYQKIYNLNTVETLSGKVETIETITPFQGMNYGIHIILKTEKETISVHLGPNWFIEKLDEKIEVGDILEIKGSRVTINNTPTIIAAEVKKGHLVLKLRDENGFPLWAGWRK